MTAVSVLLLVVVAGVLFPVQAAVQNLVCTTTCDACFGFVNASVSWSEAVTAAQSETYNNATGFLAEVYNATDNDAMLQSHSGLGTAWLGGSRGSGSDWTWQRADIVFYQGKTNGTCETYCDWGASEPNNTPSGSAYLEVRDNDWNDQTDGNSAFMVRFNVADMNAPPPGCCSSCASTIRTAISKAM